MTRPRGRGGGELCIHRIHERSRYERQFAASAYEIVVPRLSVELLRSSAAIGGRLQAASWSAGGCAGRRA
jgi:hypothetical protein